MFHPFRISFIQCKFQTGNLSVEKKFVCNVIYLVMPIIVLYIFNVTAWDTKWFNNTVIENIFSVISLLFLKNFHVCVKILKSKEKNRFEGLFTPNEM